MLSCDTIVIVEVDIMKLRFYHLFDYALLILTMLIVFCFIEFFNFQIKEAVYVIVIFVVILLFCFIDYGVYNFRLNEAKKRGTKMQGYIVDHFYKYRGLFNFFINKIYRRCALKCLVDNEIVDIISFYGISDDNAYDYICSELDKNEEKKSFPIDVYVYKNKYYFDLGSVKLNK